VTTISATSDHLPAARDVVDDLAPGGPASAEEHPAHDKRFGVGFVHDGFDAPGELLAEPSLTADIGRGGGMGVIARRESFIFLGSTNLQPSGGADGRAL
jgi:hypothetical protein